MFICYCGLRRVKIQFFLLSIPMKTHAHVRTNIAFCFYVENLFYFLAKLVLEQFKQRAQLLSLLTEDRLDCDFGSWRESPQAGVAELNVTGDTTAGAQWSPV